LRVRTFQLPSFPRRRESTPADRKRCGRRTAAFHVRAVDAFSIHGGFNAMQSLRPELNLLPGSIVL
jgi:hypothetical protein